MKSNRRPTLRKVLRQRRSNLALEVQQQHATAVRDHLITTGIFEQIGKVACYWAIDGELDLKPTIECLKTRSIEVLLPIVTDRSMWFARFVEGVNMETNQFGILEPKDKTNIGLSNGDLILAPLVGYTSKGHRLGQGGGYYDRFLHQTPEVLVIGVAHAIQQMSEFQPASHDVPLDAIVNEHGVQPFSRRAHDQLTPLGIG